ncbi:hypothetical protein COT64_01485 [Candidatus Shapirobacteria bacterium CG09_land_8_20_14_0_10_39_12]|uniref:Uncharacterized protein n=1 Tax=Candidatus Shapirobacteria bacterium CG09_land_8_20_14_0_10_39_12 TaxID=1974885 RepID=A0A2H0WPS2_9BACT|nr:MAG: hypothetical protein COT64_01485 [Candidatus Shapirobacteria bacterium CG09_land_8_20_14_0_10_39_12]
MAQIEKRRKATELRTQGKTYSQIKKALDIPKSTLSDWLSQYPLSKDQLELIKKNSLQNKEIAIEKCRQTKQNKRKDRLNSVYQNEKIKLLPLLTKELYLTGLFLYWGEGSKDLKGAISLSNTDPKVIKFYLYWLIYELKVSVKKIKVLVHLYEDMELEESLKYWSKELNISRSQFSRPYIKKSKRASIDQKGFGHGTCNIVVCDVRLKEKIIKGIEAVADYYSQKI